MAAPKHPPQWVQPFLAELARTGNVRVSADAAGVDVTNAYNRRGRYPEFRSAWERVLVEREMRASGLGALVPYGEGDSALTLPPLRGGPLPLPQGGEGLVPRTTATGAKLARVGTNRWSAAAEERFLIELGTSGKVRRAAAAAGFSEEAIYRRRRKQPAFADAWDMAVENGKARVDALLVAWSERSFDPDAVPMPADGAMPKVTVSEAIKIVQLRPSTRLRTSGVSGATSTRTGRGKKHADPFFDGWEEDAAEHDAAMERIVGKLERLGEREDRKKAEAGWTRCDRYDTWVPPGWVRVLRDGPSTS